MRIAGVTLPDTKQLEYALRSVYGVGPTRSREVLTKAKIAFDTKAEDLSPEDEQRLRALIEEFTIEGELRRKVTQDIKRLKDIRSGRGVRHERNLPVRGQRTKTNSRTRRGNVRKTMGSGRRTLEKT